MKPGELRILRALAKEGSLRFEDLEEKANLKNRTLRGKYLVNLINMGLIIREPLGEKRASLVSFGWEHLHLLNLKQFIAERLALVEARPPLPPRGPKGSKTREARERMLRDEWTLEPGVQRLKRAGILLSERQPLVLMLGMDMKQHAEELAAIDFTPQIQHIKKLFEAATGVMFDQLPESILIFHTGFRGGSDVTKKLLDTSEEKLRELVYMHFNGELTIEELFRRGAEIQKKD